MGRIVGPAIIPVITSASAYASGNVIGTVMKFDPCLNYGYANVRTIVLTDKSNSKSAIDVVMFSAIPTSTVTDKTVLAINASDLINCLGTVSIAPTDYVSLAAASNAVATKNIINICGVSTGSDNAIYLVLVSRGTPTFASISDIQVRVVSELGIQ